MMSKLALAFATVLVAASCAPPPICADDGTLRSRVEVMGRRIFVEPSAVAESQWDFAFGDLVHIGAITDRSLLASCRELDGTFLFGRGGRNEASQGTLPAFDSFTSITGGLIYPEAPALRVFDAFNQVQSIRGVVDFGASGAHIEGLRNLEEAGEVDVRSIEAAPFPSLRTVESNLRLRMRTLTGFNALRSVGGDFSVESFDSRTSTMAEAFQALESVGQTLVVRNWNDATFDFPSLRSVGLDIQISYNAFTTLQTRNLREVGGGVAISSHPFLTNAVARVWTDRIAIAGDSAQARGLGDVYLCHNADAGGTCANDAPYSDGWP